MTKEVVTSEFYELQQRIREVNENFGDLNFFKKTLYWFPYRKKDTLYHLKPYLSRSNFEFLSEAYFGWGLNPRTLSQMKKAIIRKKNLFSLLRMDLFGVCIMVVLLRDFATGGL